MDLLSIASILVGVSLALSLISMGYTMGRPSMRAALTPCILSAIFAASSLAGVWLSGDLWGVASFDLSLSVIGFALFLWLIAAAWAWGEAGRVDDMGKWLADYFLIAAILCLPVVAGLVYLLD